MGQGYVARFRKGAYVLDISNLPFVLTNAYTPPSASEEAIISRPSSVSRFSGGRRTGQNAPPQGVSFLVDIVGSSIDEVDDAFDMLEDILQSAGDEGEPLYFDWVPYTNVNQLSMFGQRCAPRSLEVLWGTVHKPQGYAGRRRSLTLTDVPIDLIVDPYPLGVEQPVARACGAIWEDWYGSPVRRSLGVGVCGSGSNKFTNPVFGHSTWNNGWTAGFLVTARKITERGLFLFGTCSAEVFSNDSPGPFTQTLTLAAVAHRITFFARRRDGSQTSSPSPQAYYNSNLLTTNWIHVGNGWWWAYSNSFTGTGGATTVGIALSNNGSVIVDGFMCEPTSFPTPFGYGDMPGWTWDSTEHASASTRSAGDLSWDWGDVIAQFTGALSLVWTPTFSSSDVPAGATIHLLKSTTATWELRWEKTANAFKFQVDINTATSSSMGFTAGTPIVFHLSWDPLINDGMILAVNGTSVGTQTGGEAATAGVRLFLGSNDAKANYSYGEFSGLTSFHNPMTTTEIADDYNEVITKVNRKRRVDWIPWHYHKDGVNYDEDSVYDGTHTNWSIVGGVPGVVDAITRMRLKASTNISTNAVGGLFLSRILVPLDKQVADMADFYGELSGTADANSSGGQYETKASVTTLAVSFTQAITLKTVMQDILSGQEVGLLTRIHDVLGTGLQIRFYYQFGADAAFYTPWVNLESKAAFLMRITPFIGFKDVRRNIEGLTLTYPTGSGFTLQVKRSAGTGNVFGDFYQVITKPTLRIFSTSAATALVRVLYDSKKHDVIGLKSTDELSTDLVYAEGNVFELTPGYLNFIVSCEGDIKRELAEVINSDALTFERITVTPRWGLQ